MSSKKHNLAGHEGRIIAHSRHANEKAHEVMITAMGIAMANHDNGSRMCEEIAPIDFWNGLFNGTASERLLALALGGYRGFLMIRDTSFRSSWTHDVCNICRYRT